MATTRKQSQTLNPGIKSMEVSMKDLSTRPCRTCNGAGAFWRKPMKQWSQNEDEPPDSSPTSLECYACQGTGEARYTYARLRTVGERMQEGK